MPIRSTVPRSAFCLRHREAGFSATGDDEVIEGSQPEPANARLPLQPPNSKLEADTTLPMRCVLPGRHKWWRAGHAYLHCRTTRAPASSNQRVPSHAFRPRTQAVPPPVLGLIHNRGSAAAASLNIVIDDNDRTSSPEQPHLFAPEDREENMACSPKLPDDESTGELGPADAELRLQPRSPQSPSPHSTVSSREADPQQSYGSCDLPRHRDH